MEDVHCVAALRLFLVKLVPGLNAGPLWRRLCVPLLVAVVALLLLALLAGVALLLWDGLEELDQVLRARSEAVLPDERFRGLAEGRAMLPRPLRAHAEVRPLAVGEAEQHRVDVAERRA
eukprot:518257-Pyramimonas_sp.AAC.1